MFRLLSSMVWEFAFALERASAVVKNKNTKRNKSKLYPLNTRVSKPKVSHGEI